MARLDKLKIKYHDIIPSLPGIPPEMLETPSLVDDIFECVVSADPTSENKYAGWLIKAWQTGSFVYEDIQEGQNSVVGTNCRDFERLKKNLFRPDGTPDIQARSLMKYKNPGQLWMAVRHLLVAEEETPSSRELKRQESALAKQHAHEVVLRDGSIIRIPMTHLAAQFYGRQSRWCTSSSASSMMFLSYASDAPLYIITTANGDRYQAYITEFNIELRDTADESVNFATQDSADLDEALNYISGLMVKNNFYNRLWVQHTHLPVWNENVDKFWSRKGIKNFCGLINLIGQESLQTAVDVMFRRRARIEILAEKLKHDIITRCTNKATVKSTKTPEPEDISHLLEMMAQYKAVARLDVEWSKNHEAHAVLSDIITDTFKDGDGIGKINSAFVSIYDNDPDNAYLDMLAHIYASTTPQEGMPTQLYSNKKLNALLWDYIARDAHINRLLALITNDTGLHSTTHFNPGSYLAQFIMHQFKGLRANTLNKISPNLSYDLVSDDINPDNMSVILTQCPYLSYSSTLSIEILGTHFFSNTPVHEGFWSVYQAYIKAGIPSLIDRRSHLELSSISPDVMFDILTDMDFLSDNPDHSGGLVSGINKYVNRGVDKEALLHLLDGVGYEVLSNYKKFIQNGNDIDWDIARYLTKWEGKRYSKGYGFLTTIFSNDACLYYRRINDHPVAQMTDEHRRLKEEEKYRKGLDDSVQAVSNVQKLLRLSKSDVSVAMEFAKTFPREIHQGESMEEQQKQVLKEVQNTASKIEIPEDVLKNVGEVCPAFVVDYIRARMEFKKSCLDVECSHQS